MTNINELLRKLPKIDTLLETEAAVKHIPLLGHRAVADICRSTVEAAKQAARDKGKEPDLKAIEKTVKDECRRSRSNILAKVINGTGVMLHTNMGRAPLGPEIFEAMASVVGGYSNLEINVLERQRGIRGPQVSSLLAQVCGSEDAIVVNNNAAAVFLILKEFAVGKRVVISRGELVQIGGGFRIPDILISSGATLVEVGTTNITSYEDFERACDENTSLLLKVHHSNFTMDGFVEAPDIKDLSPLKKEGTLLVSDLGSGNLVRETAHGPTGEPTPSEMLSAGADLVCFSGDKMLGGVQAGVIAGNKDLIGRLRKNPIMRVLRVDKITYAALQIILTHHLNGDHQKVTLWGMAWADREEVKERASRFVTDHSLNKERFMVVDSEATFGGGTTPGEKIPSGAIRIVSSKTPDAIARWFQKEEPPVVGTTKGGSFQIDFRTVLKDDELPLAQALQRFDEFDK